MPTDWPSQLSFALSSSQKLWYRHLAKRAAVSVILRDGVDGIELLMIQRAAFEGDRWSGQMAFPGGKQDPCDKTIQAAAERELLEELSICAENFQCLGRLADVNARSHNKRQPGMVISPFVYYANSPFEWIKNHEVAGVYWIPLALFSHENRDALSVYGRDLPCYYFNDKCIWGLSLIMIDGLVKQFSGLDH
ncbi:MAG: CoA pyrophosphatase [Cellvibrionales bacterium]|nr:CoA pyrophosphatase [Cellvibrionales bacterium]